jgi:eukaryotic-like serine/threonine-protein kinase
VSGPTVHQTVIGDRNIFAGVGDVNVTYELPPSVGEDRHNLLTLLGRVKSFWIEGRLEGATHAVALLALGKKTLPEAVEHPLGMLLGAADLESRVLAPDKKIGELFEEAGRLLLILGDAGSGKTTTLLELAAGLVEAARTDPTRPVPVVFHLSSWAGKRQSIYDWLVDELWTKYYIPRRLGGAFLKSNRILPLLDGFDEVGSGHHAACVEAVNHFLLEVGVPGLVVCSRSDEYAALPQRLKINGAVLLMPLSPGQIDDYLADAGERLASLRTLLREDAVLQSLAAAPLMLDVMGWAYRDLSLEDLRGERLNTPDARREHVFRNYTERMFERRSKAAQPYEQGQTLSWLSWLARNMRAHSQGIFLIERLQPSWLAGPRERAAYVLRSRVAAGLFLGLACGLAQLRGAEPFGERLGLFLLNLAVGLILGLFAYSYKARQWAEEERLGQAPPKPSRWRVARRVFNHTAVGGLAGGYLAVLLAWAWLWAHTGILDSPDGPVNGLGGQWLHMLVNPSVGGPDWLKPFFFAAALATVGTLLGLIVGLLFGLIVGIRDRKRSLPDDIQPAEILSWSRPRAKRAAIWGVLIGLLFGIAAAFGFFLYFFVNVVSWAVRLDAEGQPATGAQVLHEISMVFQVSYVGYAVFGVIFALLFGLWGAILWGMNTGRVVETDGLPNRGMRSSLKNSLLAALVVGGSGGLLDAIGKLMQTGAAEALAGFVVSLFTYGIIAGLGYGGTDIIKHYTLRRLLSRRGHAPREFAPFLEYAVRLGFMRKVGGGYIFIHSLLRDHFAGPAEPDRQA